MEAEELAILRQQTLDFIAENPSTISFVRYTRTADGAGGWIKAEPPVTIAPQIVRVIEQQRSGTIEVGSVQGESLRPEHTIIAAHDANIAEEDTFTWLGTDCEITYVRADSLYETWAEVKRVGASV